MKPNDANAKHANVAAEVLYERELRVAASPETVFDLLTDAAAYTNWMGLGADFDARPGGSFRIDFGAAHASGTILELVPHRRVVLSWGWEEDTIPMAPGTTTVEFQLIPDGDHTLVRMRHSGVSPALANFVAWGWDRYLPRLAVVAKGRDPGPDPVAGGTPPDLAALLLDAQEPEPR
jgi:uncharacterized protein YndB with AHSA1/START domain